MQFEMKQRVIAVRQFPHEIREALVVPGTEAKEVAKLTEQGWTAFSYGRPFRQAVDK